MVKNHATRIFRDIVAYLTVFGKLPFTKVKMILIIGIMYKNLIFRMDNTFVK